MKILNIKYVSASAGGRADNFYSVAGDGMMKGKIIEGHEEFWVVKVEIICPDCSVVFTKKIDTNQKPEEDEWFKRPDSLCALCHKKGRDENLKALEKAEFEAEEKACGGKKDDGDDLMKTIFGEIE